MKVKRFEKKLVLNKATVVNLEKDNMSAVKGGFQYTVDEGRGGAIPCLGMVLPSAPC
ncbi:MAG: hypothetical protein GY757_08595 [bacterium]|nr:hypothetical protein [bacterium]